jgi:hypothetical protein
MLVHPAARLLNAPIRHLQEAGLGVRARRAPHACDVQTLPHIMYLTGEWPTLVSSLSKPGYAKRAEAGVN